MCTCMVIEWQHTRWNSAYVVMYHVYKDLWDASIGEDILMMKIDILWLYSKMTLLLVIFQERYLESILCF